MIIQRCELIIIATRPPLALRWYGLASQTRKHLVLTLYLSISASTSTCRSGNLSSKQLEPTHRAPHNTPVHSALDHLPLLIVLDKQFEPALHMGVSSVSHDSHMTFPPHYLLLFERFPIAEQVAHSEPLPSSLQWRGRVGSWQRGNLKVQQQLLTFDAYAGPMPRLVVPRLNGGAQAATAEPPSTITLLVQFPLPTASHAHLNLPFSASMSPSMAWCMSNTTGWSDWVGSY